MPGGSGVRRVAARVLLLEFAEWQLVRSVPAEEAVRVLCLRDVNRTASDLVNASKAGAMGARLFSVVPSHRTMGINISCPVHTSSLLPKSDE